MNHYDGPAFYRKFVHDGTVNKHNKIKATEKRKFQYEHGRQGVTGFSRDVQRANFNNFKPYSTSSSHIDLQDNPIARITAEFKPRRHYGEPDQSVNYSHRESNEFQRISNHYHRLTSELSPSDNDVTLMASNESLDDSHQREGSLHFKFATAADHSQSSESSSRFNRFEPKPSFSARHESPFVSQNSAEPDSEESSSSNQSLNDQKVRSEDSESNEFVNRDSDLTDQSNQSSESSQSLTEDHQEDQEPSRESVKSASQTSIHDEQSVSSVSSETYSDSVDSSESSQPLGHDFSSIMHDEGQDIKNNLELFKPLNSASNETHQASENDSGELNSNETNASQESTESEESLVSDQDNEVNPASNNDSIQSSESSESINNDHFGQRPNFVAQNPTNVQPSSDFDMSDSNEEEHHEIKPSTISNYHFPNHEFLVTPKHYDDQGLDDWILKKAEILNKTLKAFNVNAQVVDWTNGPTVTQFQVKLQLGVKVSKINHLSDDLKMALAAKDIRIQAPIPGKTTCGIEIPNPKPRPVMLSEVVNSKTFRKSKSDLTIALGVDLTGKPRVTDLRKMPHGLIAGATGSGKSVFINCMLVSLMYKATPDELKMILIDPKAVEFAPYNGIPYLLSPVISEPKQAAASLKWATKEMNQRYEKLAAAGVRNIEQFNQKAEDHHQPNMKMPYILIVIDELADLMMVAGDEIETYIVRITQKARAAGIHLIVATQRPSVDVITGTMKNNIPTRVAFMVSSQVDSRTIIDQSGAERLLGKGDMLYLGNGSSHPIRLQGCFVSNQEIDRVAGFARHQEPAHYAFHPDSLLKHVSRLENQDKLMPQVLAYIAKEKTVSTSKLQRVFSIGYNRSAKIIDSLERHGYISGQEGSKPRDVYLTEKDYQKLNP